MLVPLPFLFKDSQFIGVSFSSGGQHIHPSCTRLNDLVTPEANETFFAKTWEQYFARHPVLNREVSSHAINNFSIFKSESTQMGASSKAESSSEMSDTILKGSGRNGLLTLVFTLLTRLLFCKTPCSKRKKRTLKQTLHVLG